MSSAKTSFYARDLGPFKDDKPAPELERRNDERRKAQDRRHQVRFELTKTDRRTNDGRRKSDSYEQP